MIGTALLGVSTDEWTAFGSLATAATVLIGVLSFFYERRSRRHEEAAQIRQRVQGFATAAQRVVELLKEGSPLISAAWHTASALRDQAGEQPTADALRELIGDPSAALTAAVEGWASSSAAGELRAAFADLTTAGRSLPGQLSLFWPVTVLLRRIADDAYSNGIFMRLLTGELASRFLDENPGEDLDSLTRSLAEHLHGNAAKYFIVRYEDGLLAIQAFIDTAAPTFADMRSSALLRAAQAAVPLTPDDTYTEELRQRVAGLSALLPGTTVESLQRQVDSLERAISKDAAAERLADESASDT
jgi:hypothetical protein